jgi:RNase P subunit RPR2
MNPSDDRLARILLKYRLTECPYCNTRLTTANIHVGWNPRAADDAVFPSVWLTCMHCGKNAKIARVTLPDGRFVASRDEALDALIDA